MKAKLYSVTTVLLLGLGIIASAQISGQLDQSFGSDGIIVSDDAGNAIETFQATAIQADQKIVAAGMAWDETYTARVRVARYLTDGSPDTDFGVDGYFTLEQDNEALIYDCTINSEGKIILVGATTNYQHYRVLLIQLNPDGTPDSSFGDNGVVIQQFSTVDEYYEDFARGIALDANENILVVGNSFNDEYQRQPLLARFFPDGTLDTDFGVDGKVTLPVVEDGNTFECVVVQPDGKILAGGTYSPEILYYTMLLSRFNEDGTPDTSFGLDGTVTYSHNNVAEEIWSIALTAEGGILAGGFSATVEYDYYAILTKFTTDGSIDASFGNEGIVLENEEGFNEGSDVHIQSDGKILFGGSTGDGPPGSHDMAIWKYNADGSRDLSFGEGGLATHTLAEGNVFLHGLAIQADNKIVGVGQVRVDNDNRFLALRIENEMLTGLDDNHYALAPTLSPNPATRSNRINVRFSEELTANAQLTFHSITGKLVYSTLLNNQLMGENSLSIDIPDNISNGIYLVSIAQNGVQSAASKLIITD